MAKTVSVSYSRPSWEDPSAAYDRGILVRRRLIRLNMRRDNCGSYTPNLSLCQTKLFVAVTRAHLRTFRTALMEDPGYFGVTARWKRRVPRDFLRSFHVALRRPERMKSAAGDVP